MTSLITEYFNYFNLYKEKFNNINIAVAIQVGSFYEFYSINNKKEKIGNAVEIAQLLHLQLTKKNKKIEENNRKNPYMTGFPIVALNKYLSILLDNDYVVILIDQEVKGKNIERNVSKIYTPGTNIQESNNTIDNFLMSLYIEQISNNYLVGISFIDVSTGENIVYEIINDKNNDILFILEQIYTCINTFNPREIILTHKVNNEKIIIQELINYFETNNILLHIKSKELINNEIYNINYQESILNQLFKNDSMLSIIEYLDLDMKYYAIISYIILLLFIQENFLQLLYNLRKPVYFTKDTYLTISNNAVKQLDLIQRRETSSSSIPFKTKYKSIFDVINMTTTIIGKRLLKKSLLLPIKDIDELNKRYTLIEDIVNNWNITVIEKLEKILSEITDIEKLQNKLANKLIKPQELLVLYNNYQQITKLNNFVGIQDNKDKSILLNNTDNNLLNELINYINNLINIDNINSENYSFFKKGISKDIDDIQVQIDNINIKIEEIQKYYISLLNIEGENSSKHIKIVYSDKDGWYLHTTNIKAKIIKEKCNNKDKCNVYFESNKSGTKIFDSEITKFNQELIKLNNNIKVLCKEEYTTQLNYIYNKYHDIFISLVDFIGKIDCLKSNYKIIKQYNYCKPVIKNENECKSYIKVKKIRHALIERINKDTIYISNDIDLGINNTDGIILYSMNSAGKSSLLKSIGIAVILAQAGLYVPAESFEYYPYECIMTRIIGEDNLFRSQSSFVVEMSELRNILKIANDRTLVLADEVTKGTENLSGAAIFASSVIQLAKRQSSFLFTTHLHSIPNLEVIKKLDNIKIYHLSIKIDKNTNTIIYERKLKEGQGETLYGLEVCQALDMDTSFLNDAFKIRNTIQLTKPKRSKYNKDKLSLKCEICNYKPNNKTDIPLDIHHIHFQCEADEDGYNYSNNTKFYKNEKFNLVSLCKICHINIHNEKIKINGYISTSNGIKLEWN